MIIRKLNEGNNSSVANDFNTLSKNFSELLTVLNNLTKRMTEIKNASTQIQDYVTNEEIDEEDIEYFEDILKSSIKNTQNCYNKILSTDHTLFGIWEVLGRIVNDYDI